MRWLKQFDAVKLEALIAADKAKEPG